jgi:hypothetical protein
VTVAGGIIRERERYCLKYKKPKKLGICIHGVYIKGIIITCIN